MKHHPKARSIQQKYRKKVKYNKEKNQHTIRTTVIVFSLILIALIQWRYDDSPEPTLAIGPEYRWFEAVPEIDAMLKTRYMEYKGVALDFNPEPTKFILKTSFEKSALNVEDRLTELVHVTNDLLMNSGDIPIDETYVIIVRGENQEELINKTFNGK
ncbi:hypothetical protein [Jeotgalibacillus sp. JSM ZJ347]|uniref:hypothetical protein n=1 Tax=Jeotgalibacillus sp. JSM ZJ347 TaxID=3342117 RepID=UPI0035A89AB9